MTDTPPDPLLQRLNALKHAHAKYVEKGESAADIEALAADIKLLERALSINAEDDAPPEDDTETEA